ncbi:MAG: hypothetical protein Q9M25_09270 [Mariprofundaceae bacterium]|nr:hypothetical protein [Mariprofundaceae bacterium]
MKTTVRYLSVALLGSALWLVLAIAPGGNIAASDTSLITKAANLVVSPAYAEDDEHESAKKDEEAEENDDEGKKDDEESEKEDDHHGKKHSKKHDDD